MNYRRPIILDPPNTSRWLVDMLTSAWMCLPVMYLSLYPKVNDEKVGYKQKSRTLQITLYRLTI